MMTLFPKACTDFENAVIHLRACTIGFELVQTMPEDKRDENVYQIFLESILKRYRELCCELEAVLSSLRSDRPKSI